MRAHTTLLLAATLAGVFAAHTSAQVTKPRNPPPTGIKLPATAKISASQEPDGRIRVVWNSVANATTYELARSVPPGGISPVALPNPSDTQYVDSDVKAGNTYYYQVAAVNEAGTAGLKRSAPPVTAAGPGPSPSLRDQQGPDPGADASVATPSPSTATCTGGGRYTTCNSALYEASGVESEKTGTAFCPDGYAALGGGYFGVLRGALVQTSAPLFGAKERPGWTVTVEGLITPVRVVRFIVFVVCAPAS